jgi:hypothetical protein
MNPIMASAAALLLATKPLAGEKKQDLSISLSTGNDSRSLW